MVQLYLELSMAPLCILGEAKRVHTTEAGRGPYTLSSHTRLLSGQTYWELFAHSCKGSSDSLLGDCLRHTSQALRDAVAVGTLEVAGPAGLLGAVGLSSSELSSQCPACHTAQDLNAAFVGAPKWGSHW